MKILFLSHHLPYPLDHGAKIRAFHFIRHLAEGNSVTIATLAHSRQEYSQCARLKEFCHEVIAEILPSRVRWWNALRALLTAFPSSVNYFYSSRLQRRINEKLKQEKFDVIIVFCAFMAQYVVEWKGGYRILDYSDIDSGKWRDYGRYKRFPISWAYAWEASKLRKYEREIARHFHYCTVVSPGELEEFERFEIDVPCTILPNGVDTKYFDCGEGDSKQSSTIVFVGRMDYFPNVDAISYFVKEIFPLIRQKLPKVELCIVGSNPVKTVRDLGKVTNVWLTGYVADVRCYLRNAAISVVPLRIARGTQNKILEALAMGIPTVATPEAAKGVECVPGRDILVAAGPTAFAREVIRVIENPSLRKSLAKAGRIQVGQVHTWERSMKVLDKILNEMPGRAERLNTKPIYERDCELYHLPGDF